jgi:NADH-quinone oxidoreductase subunit M
MNLSRRFLPPLFTHALARWLVVVAAPLLFALVLRPGGAQAQSRASSSPAPLASKATLALGPGPVELSPKDGGYAGEFAVENHGAEPLAVSRIAIRGDGDDVRAPAKLSARFVDGGGVAITVPPGGARAVAVSWMPEGEPRAHQVFAHVVVTSNDEAAGEVAIGVHAQIPRGIPAITDRVLSWLVFLPLLGALLAVAAHVAGRKDDAPLRKVAVTITALQCVLAFWMYEAFSPEMTRIDGNDGYQFIERAVWLRSLGVEYFVGVDGVSMPMVLLTSVLGLVASIAAMAIERLPKAFYALLFALLTGVMGVFVALDLVLFFAFWQLTLVALYFLVGLWNTEEREKTAMKLFVMAAAGSALMLFAILALWANAERTFLVDGTPVARSFAVPELMRVAFHAKKVSLLGLPLAKVAWVSLFVSFGVLLPAIPLHRWLPDALAGAPAPVAIVLAGLVVKLGAYGIVRVCFGVLPEASRWAAGTIVAIGVLGIVYGALCAMAQRDLKRMLAYGAVGQMGFCLVGLGSLTPEGIAGCLVQMTSHGLLVAILVLLVAALEERLHTRDLDRVGGLGAEVPVYSMLAGFALLGSLGLPGTLGFWGEVLALLGAFPLHRVPTLVATLGTLLTAVYHVSAIRRLLLGEPPESRRTDPLLVPFGGKVPDITHRELAAIAPLIVLALVLGLWPAPLFSLISGGVRDVTSLVNPPGPDQIALFAP